MPMINWHKCSRKTQDNPQAAMGYYEKILDGKPTGIIVKDFIKYPECEIFDWDHINKITNLRDFVQEDDYFIFDNTDEELDNKVVKDSFKKHEIVPMFKNTLSTDQFDVSIDNEQIIITPKQEVEEKEVQVTAEPISFIYKVIYEWSGDNETEYWAYNKKDATGFGEWMKKKYPSHKIEIKDIKKISICEEQSIQF